MRPTIEAEEILVTSHEQTPSGRFRRHKSSFSFGHNNLNLDLPQQKQNVPSSRTERVGQLKRLSYVLMLFIQGAFCGLCIQTLYRVLSHSNMVENERRLSFVALNLVLTGSLCMVERSSEAFDTTVDSSFVLVVVYSIALILVLSSSVIQNESNGLVAAKSICGILGWLISSYQIYRSRNATFFKDSN